MSATLTILKRKQEGKITRIHESALPGKKVKCPRCRTRIYVAALNGEVKVCVFCMNCRMVFEK